MIKVLHAIDGRAWGGAERVVAMLASGLRERGNSVSIWTSRRGGCANIFREKLENDVKVKELPLSNDADIISMVHFYSALKKYDIVHIHLSHSAVLCAVALLFMSKYYRRKVVCHFHGFIANPKHYQKFMHGICVSNAVENFIREKMPWMRTWCVYNGIDLEEALVSCPLLPSSNKVRIGYLARMSEGKGHEDLIKAFANLGRSENVELLIGGDGKLMPYLQNLAKELDLADTVKFLGFVDPKEAFSFWKSADIACFPSYTEGFGLSMLEAMASHLPIVAYANPVYLEVFDGAAVLVPIGDIEKLSCSLKKLLDNKDLRSRYGKLAYERAEKFSKDVMVDQVLSIYNEILRGI